MEEETKTTLTLISEAIIIIMLVATLVSISRIEEKAEELTKISTRQEIVSSTIDAIYEQCNEEAHMNITSQKTLRGRTAYLTRLDDGSCLIRIP